MDRIRVAVADDHSVMRDGLAMLIESQADMEMVGQAGDGIEALAVVRKSKPHVLVADITMPRCSGIEVIGKIHEAFTHTRVLVLTMHDDQAYLRSVMAAGGCGYVTKKAAGKELLNAIREVYSGRTYVNVSVDTKGLRRVVEDRAFDPRDGTFGLSDRESEVLELLAQGYTNSEIGKRLELSKKTVDTYRARISEKLGLRTRADVTRFAIEKGLLRSAAT